MTLSTDAPVEPWLTVTNASGGASGTSNEHVRKNVFEAAPGQVHVAEVFEFFKAPREAHPWPYDIS